MMKDPEIAALVDQITELQISQDNPETDALLIKAFQILDAKMQERLRQIDKPKNSGFKE